MSLRIPLVARRVDTGDARVRFDHSGEALIAEALVLRRWRERSRSAAARAAGEVFDGCRLPPGTWTTLKACAERGCALDHTLTSEMLRWHFDALRSDGLAARAPTPSKFVVVVRHLAARGLLDSVRLRERNLDSPGVPDLFLWRMKADGRPYGCRFVEVKRRYVTGGCRRREAIRASQQEEIDFLRGLGLKAGVVYVLEN